MFTSLLNVYTWQSVGRLLKLESDRATLSQTVRAGLARLGLLSKLKIRARLGLGWKASWISELGSAQARKEMRLLCLARPGLPIW